MSVARRILAYFAAGFLVAGRRAGKTTGAALLVILTIAALAGLVRVLPWILAPTIPWRVAFPFARALFASALESSLLSGPPIGFALSAAWLVERGEARALFSVGQSPARIVLQSMPVALGFAALAAVVALVGGLDAAAPGRLARSLVSESKQSCFAEATPKPADVPFVGVTWLCFPGAPPRIVGELPGHAGAFAAADLLVSDDLRSLRFSDMHLSFGVAGNIRAHVGEAHIVGLSPWGRASSLPPLARAALLATTGAALALFAAWSVLALGISRRFFALFLGGAGPVAALLVFSRLERGEHQIPIYTTVTAAGFGGLALAVLAMRVAMRRKATKAMPSAVAP